MLSMLNTTHPFYLVINTSRSIREISNHNSKEIGRLNFDENTPVYYDYQRFKSFSGKTRILPPTDKHAIIVDLASEADFEAVTQRLIENKRSSGMRHLNINFIGQWK
jgi:hypothetical protein